MFSIYAKMQSFVDESVFFFSFYTEIQDGCQKWQENDPADSLGVKNFIQIALSHTVSEINTLIFCILSRNSRWLPKMAGKQF